MKRVIAIFLFTAAVIAADKGWKLPAENTKLEKGPGVELATAQCMICHSVDYISTQPKMNRAAWTATVVKMREKYGAPVPTNNVEQVVEYLVKTYGTDAAKPTGEKRP
jgi:sulfite dehydrogenase (cytochrome) subunit B